MKHYYKRIFFLSLIFGFINCSYLSAQSKYTRLVWADEFTKTGLPDSSKWGYDAGRGCPLICGWGNNEKQIYTNLEVNSMKIQ